MKKIILLPVVGFLFTALFSADAQTLYVSCWNSGLGNGSIATIAAGGSVGTFATGLNDPMGLTFDSSGNLYEVETGSGNNAGYINEYSAAQVASGGGTPTVFASGFTTPYGLTFNSTGNLYEADESSGDSLHVFTPPSGSGTTISLNHNPGQIAFDGSGDLYIANISRGNLSILAAGGSLTDYDPSGFAGHPYGLAFNSTGNLFISSDTGDIYEYAGGNISSGSAITFATGLDHPAGLTFDSVGDLFEVDSGSGKILEFKNNEGTLDSTPTPYASGLNDPTFIAFGPTEPVPEPSILALAGLGGFSLLCRRRR
jgi:hypothetical protein